MSAPEETERPGPERRPPAIVGALALEAAGVALRLRWQLKSPSTGPAEPQP